MATMAAKNFEREVSEWAELGLRSNRAFEIAIANLLLKLKYSGQKSIELPSGVTTLEATEGGENMGENYMVRFKCGNKYFECHGHYDSWEGNSWEGVAIEVKPVEVLVTQYKPVTD